eukprot:2692030-Prymnesium_polylepis.1
MKDEAPVRLRPAAAKLLPISRDRIAAFESARSRRTDDSAVVAGGHRKPMPAPDAQRSPKQRPSGAAVAATAAGLTALSTTSAAV